MAMPFDFHTLAAILTAAAVTYGLRFGGLMLADWLPQSGRFKRFMDALPGCILVSLVAPGVLAAGLWGIVAAGCTVLVAARTRSVFLAMLTGMLVVALTRI